MKLKKVISSLLAAAMIANAGLAHMIPVQAAAKTPVNLALGGTYSASEFENGTGPEKAFDGDATQNSRWGTVKYTDLQADKWLQVVFKDGVQTISNFKITFERRTEFTDTNTNIKSYRIEAKKEGSENFEQIYAKNEGVQQIEEISLEAAVRASEVRLVIDEIKPDGWTNCSVAEFEIYGEHSGDASVEQTPNVNHMRTAEITVSSEEANTLTKDKLNDGVQTTGRTQSEITQGRSNRWASAANENTGAWIQAAFAKTTAVKEVSVNFWRDADPLYTQVSGFDIEYVDENDETHTVTVENRLVDEFLEQDDKRGYEDVVVYRFADPVNMKSMKIKNFTVKSCNFNNISIEEIEVYSNDQAAAQDIERTPDKNHMLQAAMTGSSAEVSTMGAEKLNDGIKDNNKGNRWSSAENQYQNEWVKAVLPKATEIKEIQFYLFTRDVAPMPSNIKSFDIVYKDAENASHTVSVTNQAEGDGYAKFIKHTFATPIIAKEIEIKNFVVTGDRYTNVSMNEIEVYSNEQKVKQTLEGVVASIKGGEIPTDADSLSLPEVPEGYTVEFNGADFEQIISRSGKIHHPLLDKEVKVNYNVTETATNKVKNTGDLVYIVKGTETPTENKNTKPQVIPEIQEWYSDSAEKTAVDSLTKITYSDAALKEVAEEFAADYEDFTGRKLTAVKGTKEAGAFHFELTAPDELLGEEGYAMQILPDRINVQSGAVTGNMYAMQTILQMYKEDASGYKIGQMRDYPRFETRGFLFDVARKPVSLEMIDEVARTMRYYKMNDLQLHLSDNYIFLEEYGKYENEREAFKAYDAFRLESSLTNQAGASPTAEDYYFTKAEIRDFIQDQRALGMKIVPEIDVPAHANSFTKVWPELMVVNKVSQLERNRPLIDHLDVSKQETRDKIKQIFDDYTKGENPAFDSETTVHIGADEFLDSYKAYRQFVNELVPYVKDTNTVRIWGGLTWIKDNPVTEIVPEAIENVEMNLWSKDWADGIEMYHMGYKLINTIDNYGYMVPNGNLARADQYGDLLNVTRVFNSFEPNLVRAASGYQYVPSGDDQMLGAAFALWNDNIDKRSSGLTESDLYWRFFDALPFYAEKTWAATGKEKGTADALAALAQEKGTGPNTNPYYQEDRTGNDYESYDFSTMEDGSGNGRDLTAGSGAEVADGVLSLGDGQSYVTTPIKKLGNGNALSFDVKLEKASKPGDILFETDAPYGTHDIRIMDNGKLGFTRELHDYYFDYELPVGEKVNIKITTSQQKTELFVNGEFHSSATGKYVHNDIVKKTNIQNATFALPLQRIGSKTNALEGTIDNVIVSTTDRYNKTQWTGRTNSETTKGGGSVEGFLTMALDNNTISRWHSNWNGASDKVATPNGGSATVEGGEIWAEVTFDQGYEINKIMFTPRQDKNGQTGNVNASGLVTKADLYIQTEEGGEFKKIIADAVFAADNTTKEFKFDTQKVYGFKFSAKESNDGWVAVAEFDIAKDTEAAENEQITSIDVPAKVTVEEGTAFADLKLPEKVTVHYGKNKTAEVAVTWEAGNYAETRGTYQLEGTLGALPEGVENSSGLKAKITVEVTEKAAAESEQITSIDAPAKVTVEEGTAFADLKLPAKVTVHYGKNKTAEVAVTWEAGNYAETRGTYQLEGTLGALPEGVENGSGLKAKITVEVTEKTAPKPPATEKYTIKVTVNDDKMGIVALDPVKNSYQTGEKVTATAAAKAGYEFVNWTMDGKVVSDKAAYTFEVGESNLTLKANFKAVKAETPQTPDTGRPNDSRPENNQPNGGQPNSSGDSSVKTGDRAVSPLTLMSVMILAAGAVLVVRRKKES